MELLEKDGRTIEQIAVALRVSVPRAERLIEEEQQVRDLERYKCDRVPVERIRELFERRQEEDPSLTQARVARLAGLDRTDFLRALGLARTASTIRNAQRQEGKYRSEISVGTAGRIVRALGYAPRDVPDL